MTGDVVYFYAFDVANEIVAGRIGTILGQKPARSNCGSSTRIPRMSPFIGRWPSNCPRPTARLGGQRRASASPRLRSRRDQPRAAAGRSKRANWRSCAFHEPKLDDGRPLDDLARDIYLAVRRDLERRSGPPVRTGRAGSVHRLLPDRSEMRRRRRPLARRTAEPRRRPAVGSPRRAPERFASRTKSCGIRGLWKNPTSWSSIGTPP